MAHAKIWATDAQVKILCRSEKDRKHFGRVSREKTTHSYIRPNKSEKQLFEDHLKIAILEKTESMDATKWTGALLKHTDYLNERLEELQFFENELWILIILY